MERVKVGNVEVVSLSDMQQGYAAERVYVSTAERLGPYRGFLDEEGRVVLNFASFLLRGDGRTVLVDAGNGPEREGRLLDELAAAGVSPGEIDSVLFTHLHGDHTGWNLDRATGKPLFANARYLVPRLDWEHYSQQDPAPASFTRDVAPLEELGVLELIDGEMQLSESLTAVPAPGHTPGHTAVAVVSGGAHAIIVGDAFISPIDVAEPDWPSSWDWDGAVTRQTRRTLIDRIQAQQALVGGSHLPEPSLGHFEMVEGRRSWMPVR
jgi:glyoxylase-like metal-dependent hydrolase (beta-lactamase superfamily II)